MRRHRLVTVEFVLDGFGQLFAQLHTHLVKRVYIPDDSLGKYFVLIESNETNNTMKKTVRCKKVFIQSLPQKMKVKQKK